MTMQGDDHELRPERVEAAAIMATLVEHQARRQALQFDGTASRPRSNWKWSERR